MNYAFENNKSVGRLIPGIHRVITGLPVEAKIGDTIVLLHISVGQSARLLEQPKLRQDGRHEFRVDITDDEPHV